jgi:hypothetical protein
MADLAKITSYAGSGWVSLRKVDLRDDFMTVVAEVRHDTMLTRSAEGSCVALAQSDTSNGRINVCDVQAERSRRLGPLVCLPSRHRPNGKPDRASTGMRGER